MPVLKRATSLHWWSVQSAVCGVQCVVHCEVCSVQNPGPETFQEVRERGLANFSALKKTESQAREGNGEKKTESKNSWTLFFFTPFLPHVWDSVFFRAPKLASALTFPSATFQHQGSGYSFRGAKGSLYWSWRIQIPSKCWGRSNLLFIDWFTLLI